jgi:hypothetical protein
MQDDATPAWESLPIVGYQNDYFAPQGILRGVVEVRVHGQAEHLGRQAFADRQAVARRRELRVGGLPVHRSHVIDRGRDARFFRGILCRHLIAHSPDIFGGRPYEFYLA